MTDARERVAAFRNRRISAERWKTLEPLIDEAVGLAPAQRSAFLASACEGDAPLRAELIALLEEFDKDSPVDRPAAERFASLLTPQLSPQSTVLGERYRVERELGRGGMAMVYLAHDIKHDRPVAVKVLHPELAAALGARRFLSEIRTTARLHHPHILPLHDSGETEGVLFYVMPYVEGESLRRRMDREKPLPVAEAVRIAREVAGALDWAHRHGVIHRDVKPENILLHDGSALVADFGIALALSAAASPRQTAPGLILGTPQYMSPEQATGSSAIDARTDIYALGTVLYEMLAGEPPFVGETATAVMAKRTATPAPPLHTLRPGIPTALEMTVARALERDPVNRFGTAGEFAVALEAALGPVAPSEAHENGVVESEPLSLNMAYRQPVVDGMTSVGSAPPTQRIQRRWPTVAAALTILSVIGIGWLLWLKGGSSPTPASRQRVMVTVFENRTGDSTQDQIGIEVADYTRVALKKTGLIEVADASFDQWRLGNARPTRSPDLKKLARGTQATMIVLGSYRKEGDSLVFIGEGREASSGHVVFAFDSVKASVSDRRQMVEQVRQHVMSAIATRVDPALGPWAGNESAPPIRFDAYQEFADGMTSFVRGIVTPRGGSVHRAHFASAQAHLERAFRLDSTYYIAVIWWVFARSNVDDTQGADSLIRVLDRHRGSMSKYEEALSDYVTAFSHGTPEDLYQLDKKLVRFGPASEYRYCLTRDAVVSGHSHEALKESETLDESYSWMQFMRGIPSFRVRALVQLQQFDRALAIARQARNDLPDDLSPRYPEIDALAALGRLDEIERVVDVSAATPGVSDAEGGNLMLYAGLRLEAGGRAEDARQLFAKGLASYASESPTAVGPEVILFGKARALYYLERWNEARELFDTLAMASPGTSRYERKAVIYLGSLAARLGDTAEVSRLRGRLAKSFPRDGETQYFDAHVAARLGQRDRALQFLGTAIERGSTWDVVDIGDATPSIDPDFAPLHRQPKFQRIVALW